MILVPLIPKKATVFSLHNFYRKNNFSRYHFAEVIQIIFFFFFYGETQEYNDDQ